jgi:HPt (histidine-containing phosphotransfer) domain-containing protein
MNFQELADNLGLEVDEYRELIDLFIDTGAADFKKIQDGLTGNDSDMVMRSAHTIKGAAGNLGLMDVSETARIIEEKATENQLDSLGEAMQTLKAQFEAIESFVAGA